MSFPKLKEGLTQWEIIINPNLKFARAERWKKDIKRYWGFDPETKRHKLMFVQYPKSRFSRKDMKRILPKYETCPNCSIGKKFIKKNNNNKSMNLSVIDLFGKIPWLGNLILRNRDISEKYIMQLLSVLSRYPISVLTTNLGKRLISVIVGIAGTAGTIYLAKQANVRGEWLEYFANMVTSAAEMPAQGNGFGLQSDVLKLKRAIGTGNFGGISDALLKSNTQVKRAVDRLSAGIPQLSLGAFGNQIKSFFDNAFRGRIGRLRLTETTIPRDSLSPSPKRFTGGKFNVREAGDYKYVGTGNRFRDISDFSSGFRSKRRLRIAGDKLY